jgi:hypothetical protein
LWSATAENRLRWLSLYIDSSSGVEESGALTVNISGWGFADEITFLNQVTIYGLQDATDPFSEQVQQNTCLLGANTATFLQCFANFIPRGYFLLEVDITQSSGAVVDRARSVQYGCLDPDYADASLTNAQGSLEARECVLRPVVTSVSPSSGTPGAVIIISGLGFSDNPTNNQVVFGDIACPILPVSSTLNSVSCIAGAGAIAGIPLPLSMSVLKTVSATAIADGMPTNITSTMSASVNASSSTLTLDLVLMSISVSHSAAQPSLYLLNMAGSGFAPTASAAAVMAPVAGYSDVYTNVGISIHNGTEVEASNTNIPCQIQNATTTALQCQLELQIGTPLQNSVNFTVTVQNILPPSNGQGPVVLAQSSQSGSFCNLTSTASTCVVTSITSSTPTAVTNLPALPFTPTSTPSSQGGAKSTIIIVSAVVGSAFSLMAIAGAVIMWKKVSALKAQEYTLKEQSSSLDMEKGQNDSTANAEKDFDTLFRRPVPSRLSIPMTAQNRGQLCGSTKTMLSVNDK